MSNKQTNDLYKSQKRFYKFKSVDAIDYISDIISVTLPCKHGNGWYNTIPAKWFGRRRVFVCTDCGDILALDKKEEV